MTWWPNCSAQRQSRAATGGLLAGYPGRKRAAVPATHGSRSCRSGRRGCRDGHARSRLARDPTAHAARWVTWLAEVSYQLSEIEARVVGIGTPAEQAAEWAGIGFGASPEAAHYGSTLAISPLSVVDD